MPLGAGCSGAQPGEHGCECKRHHQLLIPIGVPDAVQNHDRTHERDDQNHGEDESHKAIESPLVEEFQV